MRRILSVSVLAIAGLTLACTAQAKDYTYTAPKSPAATSALQTPAKPADASQYADLNAQADTTAIDNRPGLIRPATRVAQWASRDNDHRGFACVDDKCKTRSAVYKTETPLEQEQGRLGLN